jgi:hypothetical protein
MSKENFQIPENKKNTSNNNHNLAERIKKFSTKLLSALNKNNDSPEFIIEKLKKER